MLRRRLNEEVVKERKKAHPINCFYFSALFSPILKYTFANIKCQMYVPTLTLNIDWTSEWVETVWQRVIFSHFMQAHIHTHNMNFSFRFVLLHHFICMRNLCRHTHTHTRTYFNLMQYFSSYFAFVTLRIAFSENYGSTCSYEDKKSNPKPYMRRRWKFVHNMFLWQYTAPLLFSCFETHTHMETHNVLSRRRKREQSLSFRSSFWDTNERRIANIFCHCRWLGFGNHHAAAVAYVLQLFFLLFLLLCWQSSMCVYVFKAK